MSLDYVGYDLPTPLADTVRTVATSAMRCAIDEQLPRGITPVPQVFVFDRTNSAQPLVGHIICRGYERGPDAVHAVAHLGRIAAAVAGTDLLVTWEEADLDGPSPAAPAFAILEATFSCHTLTLVPFYLRADPHGAHHPDGWPVMHVIADQPTDSYQGVALPASVDSLLHLWRTGQATYDWATAHQIVTDAARYGYDIALGTSTH